MNKKQEQLYNSSIELFECQGLTHKEAEDLVRFLLNKLPKFYNHLPYEKVEKLAKSGECVFNFSSPGRCRMECLFASIQLEKKELLLFNSEWLGDAKTKDNFFERGYTKSKKGRIIPLSF